MFLSVICSHEREGHFELVLVSILTEIVIAWLTNFTGLHFVVKGKRRKAGKYIILVHGQVYMSHF